MEGRREDVETSPSPFSSAVSSPRDVDFFAWCKLRRQRGRSAAINPQALMSIWPFLIIMFSSVFESFSLATTCSHTMC